MPARIQELAAAIGFEKQAALQTALAAGSLWNLGIDAAPTIIPRLNRESNAKFFGKGHPFATRLYPTSLDTGVELSNFLTSQHWAQVVGFAPGVFTESGPAAGAYQYVGTPAMADPVTNGIEMAATTIVGGIRQNTGGELLDMALVGMVCTGFTLTFERGPGLANSKLVSRWAGCGKYANNSGIAIPAQYAEERIGSGSAITLLINGVNYITLKNFVRLELQYDNGFSPDSGYYLGSGQQDGFDLRGRMRYGDPVISVRWSVEGETGLTELADLVSGTEYSMEVVLRGSLIAGSTYHTVGFLIDNAFSNNVEQEDVDGYFGLGITTEPKFDGSTGPIVLTAITDKTGIGAEE